MRIDVLVVPLLSAALASPSTAYAARPVMPWTLAPSQPMGVAEASDEAKSEGVAQPSPTATASDAPSPGTPSGSPENPDETAPPQAATGEPGSSPPPRDPSAEAIEGAAPDAGDLLAEIQVAKAAREAEPSAAHWRREGAALERAGRFAEAEVAYDEALRALPPEAKRTPLEQDRLRVRELARGKVPTEPESTHRAALDERWKPAPPPESPSAADQPLPAERSPEDRLLNKWYFWVTIGAIVASAAAVTVISVRASRETRSDSLDTAAWGGGSGQALFRF